MNSLLFKSLLVLAFGLCVFAQDHLSLLSNKELKDACLRHAQGRQLQSFHKSGQCMARCVYDDSTENHYVNGGKCSKLGKMAPKNFQGRCHNGKCGGSFLS
ncbi:uncharacterized protein LOC129227508 [Uloborus diversus]|uniref:uncharacterized protein LOC129227508 n=1 Tax=Uloborus diversus TaxID=327109 RepID=UPI0024098CB0|nr:uncharacterized protein LOC129227508 [Uloborus diversus]